MKHIQKHPLLFFFMLACLFSWLSWAPLAFAGLGWTQRQFSPYLHLLGGLGPLLSAVLVTGVCEGRLGLRRLWERGFTTRGRLGWLVFAVAAPVLLFGLSAAALVVTGQGQISWAEVGRSVEFPGLYRGVYWAANLFFYGLGEEVGRRGFALPRLQTHRTALTSALVVSGIWAAWHLPLFAFSGGLSSMGLGGVIGWLSSIVTGSILMTWLFNASRGSIVAVALFHGVLDIVMTSPVQGPLPSIMGAIITLCGLVLPLWLGRENLSRAPRVGAPVE